MQDPARTWPVLHGVMALVLGGKHRWNEMLFHAPQPKSHEKAGLLKRSPFCHHVRHAAFSVPKFPGVSHQGGVFRCGSCNPWKGFPVSRFRGQLLGTPCVWDVCFGTLKAPFFWLALTPGVPSKSTRSRASTLARISTGASLYCRTQLDFWTFDAPFPP